MTPIRGNPEPKDIKVLARTTNESSPRTQALILEGAMAQPPQPLPCAKAKELGLAVRTSPRQHRIQRGRRMLKLTGRETEPFELRAQDWDAPIVSQASVGKKLDELKDGETLEAVVMAAKTELDKVATILRGTAKPHRVMLIELSKDGPTRIPGRVGNMLRFRQAKTAQIHSAGKAACRLRRAQSSCGQGGTGRDLRRFLSHP